MLDIIYRVLHSLKQTGVSKSNITRNKRFMYHHILIQCNMMTNVTKKYIITWKSGGWKPRMLPYIKLQFVFSFIISKWNVSRFKEIYCITFYHFMTGMFHGNIHCNPKYRQNQKFGLAKLWQSIFTRSERQLEF